MPLIIAADVGTEILAPACIVLFGFTLTYAIKFYGLKAEKKAAIAAKKKLIDELKRELEAFKTAAHEIDRRNNNEIEGQKQEIIEMKAAHAHLNNQLLKLISGYEDLLQKARGEAPLLSDENSPK